MKKLISIIIALVLMLSAFALADQTYEFTYSYDDFYVYDSGAQTYINVKLVNSGKLGSDTLTAQLVDQTDGTVLSEKVFEAKKNERAFAFTIPADWSGLHNLAVYVDGEKCSKDFPLFVREYERCLKRVDTDQPVMAVTIDCGAGGNVSCAKWLALLEKYDAHCTFFLTGDWAQQHPESVLAIQAAGHEIGNHSYTHAHWDTLKNWEAWKHQILDTQDVIESITGERPTLFRVPYGDWSYSLRTVLRNEGFKELVQWNIESHDSRADATVSLILRSAMPANVQPGSIVLFHNDDPAIDSLNQVLDYYTKTCGYRLVTVSELLGEGEYHIDDNFVAHHN